MSGDWSFRRVLFDLGAPSLDIMARVVYEVSPRKKEENAQCARDGYELVKMMAPAAVA